MLENSVTVRLSQYKYSDFVGIIFKSHARNVVIFITKDVILKWNLPWLGVVIWESYKSEYLTECCSYILELLCSSLAEFEVEYSGVTHLSLLYSQTLNTQIRFLKIWQTLPSNK